MNEPTHTGSANHDEVDNNEAGNDEAPRPPSQLFTVRIWPEVSNQGAVTWRGKVQQVPNGAWRYFHDWPTLTAFLQTQVKELAAETQQ